MLFVSPVWLHHLKYVNWISYNTTCHTYICFLYGMMYIQHWVTTTKNPRVDETSKEFYFSRAKYNQEIGCICFLFSFHTAILGCYVHAHHCCLMVSAWLIHFCYHFHIPARKKWKIQGKIWNQLSLSMIAFSEDPTCDFYLSLLTRSVLPDQPSI